MTRRRAGPLRKLLQMEEQTELKFKAKALPILSF